MKINKYKLKSLIRESIIRMLNEKSSVKPPRIYLWQNFPSNRNVKEYTTTDDDGNQITLSCYDIIKKLWDNFFVKDPLYHDYEELQNNKTKKMPNMINYIPFRKWCQNIENEGYVKEAIKEVIEDTKNKMAKNSINNGSTDSSIQTEFNGHPYINIPTIKVSDEQGIIEGFVKWAKENGVPTFSNYPILTNGKDEMSVSCVNERNEKPNAKVNAQEWWDKELKDSRNVVLNKPYGTVLKIGTANTVNIDGIVYTLINISRPPETNFINRIGKIEKGKKKRAQDAEEIFRKEIDHVPGENIIERFKDANEFYHQILGDRNKYGQFKKKELERDEENYEPESAGMEWDM